jgi:hypothetical protein
MKKFDFSGVNNIKGASGNPKNGLMVNDNCRPIKANIND